MTIHSFDIRSLAHHDSFSIARSIFAQYSSSAQEKDRFAVFEKSLLIIDKLNEDERAINGRAVFGVTIFSDLSDKEFQSTYLGTKPPVGLLSTRRLMQIAPQVTRTTDATSVDWRGIYTTPIKYQGSCGSCWCVVACFD